MAKLTPKLILPHASGMADSKHSSLTQAAHPRAESPELAALTGNCWSLPCVPPPDNTTWARGASYALLCFPLCSSSKGNSQSFQLQHPGCPRRRRVAAVPGKTCCVSHPDGQQWAPGWSSAKCWFCELKLDSTLRRLILQLIHFMMS